MASDAATVAQLRKQTGAGMLDCKKALDETGGDLEAAAEILRKKGMAKAAKKGERSTEEGLIHSYIHAGGSVGVMVEVLCETDFVARNDQFAAFVHDIALHIAAVNPLYVNVEDVPEEVVAKEKQMITDEVAGSGKPADVVEKIVSGKLDKYLSEIVLMKQAFVKDEDVTIEGLLTATVAKTGENIRIKRFTRYTLGE